MKRDEIIERIKEITPKAGYVFFPMGISTESTTRTQAVQVSGDEPPYQISINAEGLAERRIREAITEKCGEHVTFNEGKTDATIPRDQTDSGEDRGDRGDAGDPRRC